MWLRVAVLVLSVSSIDTQLVTHTNGSSGQPCPVKKCLAGRAQCINDECVCNPPFVLYPNNGHFACYRTNEVFGEIKNDPTIINFNNETATFPFPCRYLVTSTTTDLRIDNQTQGTCRCQVHAWNSKCRGKLFVGGFDYACLISNILLNETLGFSVRKEGIAENGQYTYKAYAANSYAPSGSWPTTPANFAGAGVNVNCGYDLDNNQAGVAVPECGYTITFVAYDVIERRNQAQIPGLSVAINLEHNPVFHDNEIVMATAPTWLGGTTYQAQVVPPLTVPEFLLIRGFSADVVQNQPDGAAECYNVGEYLKLCINDGLILAAKQCFWMLDEPHFIRCMNNETSIDRLLVLLDVSWNVCILLDRADMTE